MTWLLLALSANSAQAVPFHACTFFAGRLENQSWPGGLNSGCADFEMEYGACTKTKQIGHVTVSYPGVVVRGRLPAYFVEVTPFRGESVFTKGIDGTLLEAQLALAESFYESTLEGGPLFDGLRRRDTLLDEAAEMGHQEYPQDELTQFFYGRTIRVPYAADVWTIPSVGWSTGSAAPTCFDGVSEYIPHTWSDLNSPEQIIAATLAPVSTVTCNLPGAALLQKADVFPDRAVRNTCAFPVTRPMALTALAQPGTEWVEGVINPAQSCMGRLGPLLPRTGSTRATNVYDAAYQAAYRIASASEDYFETGPGIESKDRWQVVWPPVADPLDAQCHQPGAVLAHQVVKGGPTFLPAVPATDGDRFPEGHGLTHVAGKSPVVFAVWKYKESCVEPFQGPLFALDVTALGEVRDAVCDTMNATGVMP